MCAGSFPEINRPEILPWTSPSSASLRVGQSCLHYRSVRAYVDYVWNVMAHAQKTDFVFRRNGRVHLNRRGSSVQSTAGRRGVRISGSNAGYTTFRGRVKGTGYPLHSPVSPPLPLPCVAVCHHISAGLYLVWWPLPRRFKWAGSF